MSLKSGKKPPQGTRPGTIKPDGRVTVIFEHEGSEREMTLLVEAETGSRNLRDASLKASAYTVRTRRLCLSERRHTGAEGPHAEYLPAPKEGWEVLVFVTPTDAEAMRMRDRVFRDMKTYEPFSTFNLSMMRQHEIAPGRFILFFGLDAGEGYDIVLDKVFRALVPYAGNDGWRSLVSLAEVARELTRVEDLEALPKR